MVSFTNDYSEGAAPEVLAALTATNLVQMPGYGADDACASAAGKIRAACGAPDADVHFLMGGTQTNLIVIDALLASYEGVVACDTGHVALHEAGAIEASGHKVLTVPGHDGKMHAEDLAGLLAGFYADPNHAHMVFPGMAYVSHPTEYGTLYTRAELEGLRSVCDKYDIPLYVDGARLGYALAAPGTDVTLPDLARLAHAFYVGGTKVGALCGEAVVFPRHGSPRHFVTRAKSHGGLLAKGRLLGVQFDALFTDGLYLRLAKNAIARAHEVKRALAELGFELFMENPTNQTFVVMDRERLDALGKRVAFEVWEPVDDERTVIRLATSWATTEEQVEELVEVLRSIA